MFISIPELHNNGPIVCCTLYTKYCELSYCHSGQFQKDATQVVSWIRNGEAMLAASFSIPGALAEAEQLKREHDQFQVAVEKTHASAVQVKYRADALRAANHYDPHTIR